MADDPCATAAIQGDLLAELAIADVEQNADSRWLAAARSALRTVAHELPQFTTDDLWRWLDEHDVPAPREPRAMGPVVQEASRDGFIVQSGEYVKSKRPENHSRPVPVWRAL